MCRDALTRTRFAPRSQLAYTSGVGSATHAPGGCRNRIRTPRQSECRKAENELLRNMHICENDAGTIWNSWSCGFARHWDCRNSERRRACPTKHYARTNEFFVLDDLNDGHDNDPGAWHR